MRIAVLCDSTGSHNNGASSGSWVDYLDTLVRSGGVRGWTFDNYSVPGLTWKTAHVPTSGFLIGGTLSPLDAIIANGTYNRILISMGVNDRKNLDALADFNEMYAALRTALPNVPVAFVAQHFILPDGTVDPDCIVTMEEAQAMEAVYATINDRFYGAHFGKLYAMGYSYDVPNLHPTNSGKQWLAASVYMGLQEDYALTPITRNIAWLWEQPKDVQDQMRKANT